MSRKQSLLASLVLAVAGALIITFLSNEIEARKRRLSGFFPIQPHAGLPVLGAVHEFTFTDARGNQFHNGNLEGKIWIADFIFTNCPGICPVMTSNMAEIQKAFVDNDDVSFVSFSVDPDNDTPEVLSAYGERYGANPERWHFLTGEQDTIHRLAVEGFKIGSVDDPLIHSPHFVLIDPRGQIRGYYTGTDLSDTQRLIQDIDALFKEVAVMSSVQ